MYHVSLEKFVVVIALKMFFFSLCVESTRLKFPDRNVFTLRIGLCELEDYLIVFNADNSTCQF